MGGREENPDPALQSFVTGVYIPSAEGGTAFFSPRLPPLFLFVCILAFYWCLPDNKGRWQSVLTSHKGVEIPMLTFEKVLEIFEDYLAQDMELEVYKSRYGYVCVTFNGSPPDPPYCEGDVCRTPEELFDHLLVEYESFASIQLTKGRREENEADEEQVRRLCQKYLDRREEAMK